MLTPASQCTNPLSPICHISVQFRAQLNISEIGIHFIDDSLLNYLKYVNAFSKTINIPSWHCIIASDVEPVLGPSILFALSKRS